MRVNKNEIEATIKSTLLKLLSKNTIDNITAVSFAKECGISRTSFYSYYDSVYSVLQEIEDNYLDDFTEKMLKAVYNSYHENRNRAKVFSDVFNNDIDKSNYTLRILLGPHGDVNFETKLRKRLKELYLFNVHLETVESLTPFQQEVLLEYRVSGKLAAMKWFANNGSSDKLEEFYDLTIRIDDYIDSFYK